MAVCRPRSLLTLSYRLMSSNSSSSASCVGLLVELRSRAAIGGGGALREGPAIAAGADDGGLRPVVSAMTPCIEQKRSKLLCVRHEGLGLNCMCARFLMHDGFCVHEPEACLESITRLAGRRLERLKAQRWHTEIEETITRSKVRVRHSS